MKIFLYIYLLIQLIYAEKSSFEKFIEKYSKNYKHDEFKYRYNIFSHNDEFIESNNLYNNNYKLKLNQFSDLSIIEFEKQYLSFTSDNEYKTLSLDKDLNCKVDNTLNNIFIESPDEFDWEKKNKVSCVKNQGKCGSCWAFSTVAAIESENAIVNNKLINLSEQELIDCAGDEYDNKGCGGGLMENAFHYVIDRGLCSEENYPYEGVDNICRNCKEMITISDCREIPSYNETVLKYALLKKPISVVVDASSLSFQFYSNGILNSGCGTRLNHAVLLVGYGEENGNKYWRIKNSWGKDWGEDGYIRLARQDTNKKTSGICGITKKASYPII
jgi:KDEL-tailed cysteine endopeptidase